MRRHILVATATVFVLSSAGLGSAQERSYGPGYRGHYAPGYGTGWHHGGDCCSGRGVHRYGSRWRDDDRDGGGRRWRGDDRSGGYGPGWRQRDDEEGPTWRRWGGRQGMGGPFEMMSPGMMVPGMMRMVLSLMDTDNDGALSLAEFQAAHERIFRSLDTNKDGRLTVEEIQALVREGSQWRRSTEQSGKTEQMGTTQPGATPPSGTSQQGGTAQPGGGRPGQ